MNVLHPEIVISNYEINEISGKYHFNDTDTEYLQSVYTEMKLVINPIIYFDIIKQGKMLSFVQYDCYVAVIASLGKQIDQLQDSYMLSNEILKAYMVECISLEILLKMYRYLDTVIEKKEYLKIKDYDFIGDKFNTNTIAEVFTLIKPKDIAYTAKYMLEPKKSVVYIGELTSDNSKTCCNICTNCSNSSCNFKISNNK